MESLRTTFDVLRKEVGKHISLTDTEFAQTTSFFAPRRLRKGQYLLQEGEVSKHMAFVSAGFLRAYTVDEKGDEHVDQFAFEGWWISDPYSFLTGKPGIYFIDALEDSDLLLIEHDAYENLCATVPKFEHYFRVLLENHLVATHKRLLSTISLPAEQRYLELLQSCPNIPARVALRNIASYLGITPEALSRIRGRLSKKHSQRP